MPVGQTQGDDTPIDPSQAFTDRDDIVKDVRRALHSTQPGNLHLLCVKGSSGTGKTALIDYLAHQISDYQNWFPYRITFVEPVVGREDILDKLAAGLKKCVSPKDWKHYTERISAAEKRLSKLNIVINQHIDAKERSKVKKANQSMQVEDQSRAVTQKLESVKINALRELAGNMKHPLCLLVDNYERLNEIDERLGNWFCNELLPDIAQSSPQPLIAVICGWEWPETAEILTKRLELTDFTSAQIQEYLEKLALLPASVAAETKKLIHVLVQVTGGYPMALALAAELLSDLDRRERKITLFAHRRQFERELQVELRRKMQVEFLEERLLEHLPNPYRSLLKWSPLLRSFNREILQILLSAISDVTGDEKTTLSIGEYERFLRYPFIQQNIFEGQIMYDHRSLHEIVRWVGLGALHIHKDQVRLIQKRLAEYYQQQAENLRAELNTGDTPVYQLKGMVEEEFYARLEYFYHAFQARDLEPEAFEQWENLMTQAINGWQQQYAALLLEVIRQLERDGDGEIPLNREHRNRYLFWYGRFLAQGAHWQQARAHFERAILHQKGEEEIADLATAFNEIGLTYYFEKKLHDALSFFTKALSLREQMGDALAMAICLNNIASIYHMEGNLEQALDYCKRAQSLLESVDDSIFHAEILDNIGLTYQQQGKLEEASDYYKQALNRKSQTYASIDTAVSLTKIGGICSAQGKTEEAIEYFAKALGLYKEIGCSFESETAGILKNLIACCIAELERLANCYRLLGEDKKSDEYLDLAKQIRRKTSEVF